MIPCRLRQTIQALAIIRDNLSKSAMHRREFEALVSLDEVIAKLSEQLELSQQ